MLDTERTPAAPSHTHVFLGTGHERSERRTWAVIALCTVMMTIEIVGGILTGSLALIADGLHMSTHAGAMLIAALSYTYARRHAHDPRFVFGTGKLGDLAGFTSAVVLAMIAALIGYEALLRLLAPIPIRFGEAIPIAIAGLLVNLVSAWLLGGGGHGHPDPQHEHVHEHVHEHEHDHRHENRHAHAHATPVAAHRDNNIRSAFAHVMADAAVSCFAIVGLMVARSFGWLWMDPLAGIVGAGVIANWSYVLVRDTAAILLDMNPDRALTERVRETIESGGDRLLDLHIWRLGPGHLGAEIAVLTREDRDGAFYRRRLQGIAALSHLIVEVRTGGMQ